MNKQDFHELLQVTLLAWDTENLEQYAPFNPQLVIMGKKFAHYLRNYPLAVNA